MRKALFVFLALALAACATAAVAQQAPPQGPPQGPPAGGPSFVRGPSMVAPAMAVALPQVMMIDRSADMLQLTDDQKTKLIAAVAEGEAALKALRPKLDTASKALRDAVVAPSYEENKVTRALDAALNAEKAIAASEIGSWAKIRAILTPEQLTKLSESMSRRMMGGGGNRPGGNRGGQPGNQPGGPPPDAPAPER